MFPLPRSVQRAALRCDGAKGRTVTLTHSGCVLPLTGKRDERISTLLCQKPFQCRYCPYGASQKGNLKTHVLCVHRMPFDNSQYPDRRFKRSRGDSDTSEEGHPADDAAPVQE
ncbi:hypothetical protein SKAU_G00345150 [Synaphobranchus kaupii]|uniref:C2H2-type domain-containing protein n=1 Tax=Synaphobranchus kaupii TaxID=118154 RepID=A0A9Q1EJD8_SYNKA|nr:hypothetical protein SKAU_G00345150 [Synaphobranchus kaupii]